MKRMLKKLSAIALAGAMVLSLSVTALATDPTGDMVDKDTIAAAKGETTGTVSAPNGIPDNVLKIKLPVDAANHAFDLIFDPHNLIRESGNALEIGGSDATFAEDTLVYFKNAGDVVSFSKTSDPIKVINKSSVPITVGMKATWDKKAAEYSLANSDADLAAAKLKGEAALYLSLVEDHTSQSAPVVETDKGTPVITWTYEKTDANGGAGKTADDLVYLKKYIKSVTFEYTENADTQDMEILNKGVTGKTPANWTIALATTTANNKIPQVTFANIADVTGKYESYNLSTGAKTETAYTAVSAPSLDIVPTNNPDGTKSYSIKAGTDGKVPEPKTVMKIQRGNKLDVAYITFEWDYEAVAQNGFAPNEVFADATDTTKTSTFTIKFAVASGSGAELKTDLNRVPGAYHLAKKEGVDELEWALVEGYTYEDTDDDKFESVSFRLTAAITDGDICAKAWNTAFPSSVTGTELKLIWTAYECTEVEPSVTVTSALTSNTGTATLKVDWGYGDYKATTISAASYTVNGAATALPLDNIAIDGTSVTITSVSALYAEGGANGKLTLTFSNPDTGYSKDVTVDLKTAAS